MEAKKQNKKKLIIALALLAVIVVASVVTTVVLVLAASQQNVTSTINVTYTAQEVSGTVTAGYMREDATDFTAMGSGATFVGGQGVTTATLATEATNVELGGWYNANTEVQTPDGTHEGDMFIDYVIFKYTFTNTSATRNYTATLTYTDNSTSPAKADSNITFSYWATAASNTAATLDQSTTTAVANATLKSTGAAVSYLADPATDAASGWTTVATPTSGNIVSFTVNGNSAATTYVYLKVAVTDTASNAEFSGNFAWALAASSAVA